MAMGEREEDRQQAVFVSTSELRSAGHPFYRAVNKTLRDAKFDRFAEQQCRKFYAEKSRPSIAPGVYFRMLMVGYFEGIDSERGIAWRCADSLALREFLGCGVEKTPSDHSSVSRTRRRLDIETHEAVCGLTAAFQARHPTFVQHLAPIGARVRLAGDSGDLARIVFAVDRIDRLDPRRPFAVQCRKTDCTIAGPHGEAPYGARDVEVRVGSYLEGKGLTVDRESPDQVVSVLLSGTHAFVGVSEVRENLAAHADEHRRRSTRTRMVSRARHKIEEAIDTFRILVSGATQVLDLGAAPGGWTAVLVEAGASVVAVDPGELSPAVAAHPRVSHLRCRVEEVSLAGRLFGLIVNDMSLDPPESAALMCRAARNLESGGPAVMTIKLPSLRVHAHIREATRILEHAYDVMDVRHLFHNRQEVTAFLVRQDTVADGWQRHLVKRPR